MIEEWLKSGNGTQDALDDPALWEGLRAMLGTSLPRTGGAQWEELDAARLRLLITFLRLTMRPRARSSPATSAHSTPSRRGKEHRSFGRSAPNLDAIHPQDLVESLDAIAAHVTRAVTLEVC